MNVVTDWAPRVRYAEPAPSRKAAVALLDNGAYYTEYGHITNPTEGDYSTGALDRYQGTIKFYCDPPEPDFTPLAVLGQPDNPWTAGCPGARVHSATR